jgi:addiction module RelB/DinJ family antitoxin
MNTKTLLTIKTDKVIKNLAQDVASEIGVPLSTVINAFLKQFVRDREVSFSASYKPSAHLRDVIARGEKELAEGKVVFHKGSDLFLKNLKS